VQKTFTTDDINRLLEITERRFYTSDEVMGLLRIGKDRFYQLVRHPEFPAVKVGAEWRIPRREFDDWVARQLAEKAGGVHSVAG